MDRDKDNIEEAILECKIHVNEQVVTVIGEQHTGTDIKHAAIKQGVHINENFMLSIEDEPGKTRTVDDKEMLTVRENSCFVASPKPDTSKIEIAVNAQPHSVTDPEMTFEQIVGVAFPDHKPNPNIVFSMTYSRAASEPYAGTLGPGGSVKVKSGTTFDVTITDKS